MYVRVITRALILAIALAPPVFGQSLEIGEAIPLTNTRYGLTSTRGVEFVSNGRDTFALWDSEGLLRVTKVVEGERRVGRPVATDVRRFDVVWTGMYFLVAYDGLSGIQGRLLDATGEPIGGAFPLSLGGSPQLARVGSRFYLFSESSRLAIQELSATGTLLGPERLLTEQTISDLAVAVNGNTIGIAISDAVGVHFLLTDDRGQVTTQRLIRTVPSTGSMKPPVSMAANGNSFLVAWTTQTARSAFATVVSATGQPGRAILVSDDAEYERPAVVANGTGYTLAFVQGNRTVAVAAIDSATETATAPQALDTGRVFRLGGAWAPEGRVWIAVSTETDGFELIETGPGGELVPFGYAAAAQTLRATASASDATLVIWHEIADGEARAYGGIRRHDGTWIELPLTIGLLGPESILAASDGQEFLVLVVNPVLKRTTAYRVDRQLRVTASGSSSAVLALDVTWSGSSYAVAGFTTDTTRGVVTVSVSRGGVFSDIVPIPTPTGETIHDVAIASNGTGFLVAWEQARLNLFPPAGVVTSIRSVVLDANRQPLQPSQALFEMDTDTLDGPSVVWDSRRYVIAFGYGDRILIAPVGANGAPTYATAHEVHTSEIGRPRDIRVIRRASTPTIGWLGVENISGRTQYGLLHLAAGLEVVHYDSVPLAGATAAKPIALSNGQVGIVASEQRLPAPHHGAHRLTLRVTDVVPLPAPPPAPRATVRKINGQIQLDWEAVEGPVDGYRVETRTGDGSWNEIARWYDPDELFARWIEGRAGVTYALRVRAFNDAGPGEYSDAAVIVLGKRRSVR